MTRWLVASGGASHGSFQLGWAESFVHAQPDYAGYAGTSVGALLATQLAHFDSFAEGVASYAHIWDDQVQHTSDIYKTWWPRWLGPLAYLPTLWKGSIFSAAPLRALLQENISPAQLSQSSRELRICAVDMTTGDKRIYTKKDVTRVDGWKFVYGSASYPMGFEPIHVDGDLLTDGGVRDVTPLGAALKAGATEVDVLLTRPSSAPLFADGNILTRGLRMLDLMMDEITENDLRRCQEINRGVTSGEAWCQGKRFVQVNVHRPATPLFESSLNFDADVWRENRRRGRAVAIKALGAERAY